MLGFYVKSQSIEDNVRTPGQHRWGMLCSHAEGGWSTQPIS